MTDQRGRVPMLPMKSKSCCGKGTERQDQRQRRWRALCNRSH
jgi:hypothetical protein